MHSETNIFVQSQEKNFQEIFIKISSKYSSSMTIKIKFQVSLVSQKINSCNYFTEKCFFSFSFNVLFFTKNGHVILWISIFFQFYFGFLQSWHVLKLIHCFQISLCRYHSISLQIPHPLQLTPPLFFLNSKIGKFFC